MDDHCERCKDSGEFLDEDTGKIEICPDCCPHDEHDHGICLSCSKDVLDDLIDRADMLKDE